MVDKLRRSLIIEGSSRGENKEQVIVEVAGLLEVLHQLREDLGELELGNDGTSTRLHGVGELWRDSKGIISS